MRRSHVRDVSYPPLTAAAAAATQAVMNTFKSVVGIGILALPGAMRATGLLLGSALLVASTVCSVFTMQLLMQCVGVVRSKRQQRGEHAPLEYADLGEGSGRYGVPLVMVAAVVCQVRRPLHLANHTRWVLKGHQAVFPCLSLPCRRLSAG